MKRVVGSVGQVLQVAGVVLAFAAVAVFFAAIVWATIQEPSIVGPFATAAAAIVVFALQQRGQREDAIKEARRERLADFYEEVTKLLRSLPKQKGQAGQRRAEKVLGEFQDKMLIWGPAPVVRAWADAMRVWEGAPASAEAMVAYARVLAEIRRELGQEDQALPVRDLLRLFVTDIDQNMTAEPRVGRLLS